MGWSYMCFKKGNRDQKDISYLKIKKVHKQERWIGLIVKRQKSSYRNKIIDCGPLF